MENLLEFFPVFTLFGSVIVFWLVTLMLFVVFVLSDIGENGYVATGALSIFIFLTWRWSDFSVFNYLTLYNILLYVGLGFIYAAIKSLFYGRQIGKKMSLNDENNYYGDGGLWSRSNLLKKLKANVTRWWFLWPVSLINWILSDFIKDIYNWVYDKVGGIFIWLFEVGIKEK